SGIIKQKKCAALSQRETVLADCTELASIDAYEHRVASPSIAHGTHTRASAGRSGTF
ncbi:hypothetical protein J6590_103190, partial [Homalodisca vitripennis]